MTSVWVLYQCEEDSSGRDWWRPTDEGRVWSKREDAQAWADAENQPTRLFAERKYQERCDEYDRKAAEWKILFEAGLRKTPVPGFMNPHNETVSYFPDPYRIEEWEVV